MRTPDFQQLTGLLDFTKSSLRADLQLVGDGAGQYGYDPDQVCKAIYPHKLFEVQQGGYAKLCDWGRQNVPALAVFVERGEFQDVRGSMSGTSTPVGMHCPLGVQYVFHARSKDITTQAFAAHFAFNIWWAICKALAADFVSASSTLRDTCHIEALEIGSYNLLPPMEQAQRAIEADLVVEFKRPPWDTGADSSLVTDLASIYGNLNEKGESGDEPLVQSKWSQ